MNIKKLSLLVLVLGMVLGSGAFAQDVDVVTLLKEKGQRPDRREL